MEIHSNVTNYMFIIFHCQDLSRKKILLELCKDEKIGKITFSTYISFVSDWGKFVRVFERTERKI
jgi:hypothetical protein